MCLLVRVLLKAQYLGRPRLMQGWCVEDIKWEGYMWQSPSPRWALCTHIVRSEQILGPVKIPACRRRTLTLCSSSSSSSLLAAVTSASSSPRLSPPRPPSLPTSSHLRCAVTSLSVGAVGRPPVQPDACDLTRVPQ